MDRPSSCAAFGRHQRQSWKVGGVAPSVAREQRASGDGGMRTDHEIRQDPGSRSAAAAIRGMRASREEQGIARQFTHKQARRGDFRFKRLLAAGVSRQLRVDHRVDEQRTACAPDFKLRLRLVGPFAIVLQHVDDGAGINQDHFLSALNPGSPASSP